MLITLRFIPVTFPLLIAVFDTSITFEQAPFYLYLNYAATTTTAVCTESKSSFSEILPGTIVLYNTLHCLSTLILVVLQFFVVASCSNKGRLTMTLKTIAQSYQH